VSPLAITVVSSGLAVAGLLLVVTGLMAPAPSLARTIEQLRRPGVPMMGAGPRVKSRAHRLLTPVVRELTARPRLMPNATELRLANRTAEQHVVSLVAAAFVGLVAPPLVLGALQAAGLLGRSVFIPVVLCLVGAAAGPLVLHALLVERAAAERSNLRYQVSAYLDVVTMLLAGNSGYEGALEQGAHAGDGRLFVELRRRVRESGARGSSLTDALARTGRELGLDELEQIAATAALSASEGAPVARTLAAKCATLRSALSTEQESEARLRTSRLTAPIVGMALIFMALVMYPALSFS
jgi:tight adherence protein C